MNVLKLLISNKANELCGELLLKLNIDGYEFDYTLNDHSDYLNSVYINVGISESPKTFSERILLEVEGIKSRMEFENYSIDTTQLELVAPHLNFISLLHSVSSQKSCSSWFL